MSGSERAARAMAAVGGGVAFAATVAPRTLLGAFGIPAGEVTEAATLGWRLFAMRTAYLSALAWRGDETARSAFGTIQALDQAVFWHAAATGAVPRRTAILAAGTSGVIVGLDRLRRTAPR